VGRQFLAHLLHQSVHYIERGLLARAQIDLRRCCRDRFLREAAHGRQQKPTRQSGHLGTPTTPENENIQSA